MRNKFVISILTLVLMLFCTACESQTQESIPDSQVISQSTAEYTNDVTLQSASTTTTATATETQTTSETAAVTTTVTTETTVATSTATVSTTTAVQIPVKESYNGIDVSRWQGSTVDFEKVRGSGVEIVYIKLGDSLSHDMYFEQNAENAKNAGLLRGFYYYVKADTAQKAQEEALYFSQELEKIGYECRPAVDFEAFGNLSTDAINEVALEFAQTVEEETGIAPIFYTDADNADIWCEELTKYPLWIADYDANPPASIGKWEKYAGFQYSCTGVVDGITENVVDLDIFTSEVLF